MASLLQELRSLRTVDPEHVAHIKRIATSLHDSIMAGGDARLTQWLWRGRAHPRQRASSGARLARLDMITDHGEYKLDDQIREEMHAD